MFIRTYYNPVPIEEQIHLQAKNRQILNTISSFSTTTSSIFYRHYATGNPNCIFYDAQFKTMFYCVKTAINFNNDMNLAQLAKIDDIGNGNETYNEQ